MGLLKRRELLIDRAGDQPMQILAAALEQSLVGRVSDQRVLELVSRVGGDAAHIKQFRVGQLAQRALQIFFGDRMDRVQQLVGELAADHGADLDDLPGRPQPIQPRHQRIMQGRRDLAPGELRAATFEHRPCQLLDKQRHPAGALDHRRDGIVGHSALRAATSATIVRISRALSRLSVICV